MNLYFFEVEWSWQLIIALLTFMAIAKCVLTIVYEFGKQLLPPVDLLKKYCR